ncbi:uncharacterized protein LOC143841773 isoform X2 [Paroedura picta]|uniref:uncharacterized protein LOC143841773 isoform X2 n=1 Tax=Paroedura picta TaxID=143630 RepID=UPI0040570F7A
MNLWVCDKEHKQYLNHLQCNPQHVFSECQECNPEILFSSLVFLLRDANEDTESLGIPARTHYERVMMRSPTSAGEVMDVTARQQTAYFRQWYS